jgi:hypothetical protein
MFTYVYRKHAYPDNLDNRKVFRDTTLEDVQLSESETMISLYREVFNHISLKYPNRCTLLSGFSNALYVRFAQTNQLTYLDEAITLRLEALSLRPAPHPYRSNPLAWVSHFLWRRFCETGYLTDLEEAIIFRREALELRPLRRLPTRRNLLISVIVHSPVEIVQ